MVATPWPISSGRTANKLASLMGIEGGHSIETRFRCCGTTTAGRALYDADLVELEITRRTLPATLPIKVHHTQEGLTEFGKDVVYEMTASHDGGYLARGGQDLLSHPEPNPRAGDRIASSWP